MNGSKIVSMKLLTGEEIICRAISINEDIDDGSYTFTVQEPYRVEYNSRKRKTKCNLVPWLILTDQEEHIIDASVVLKVSEVTNLDILDEYKKIAPKVRLMDPPKKLLPGKEDTSGYVGNTQSFRDLIEKIFKADAADRNK